MIAKQIEIGGRKRPVFFGFYAFKVFEDETGIKFSKMGESLEDMSIEVLVAFIYAGLVNGSKKENKEIDFEKEDVFNWLDDYLGSIEDIMTVFTSSIPSVISGEKKQIAPKSKTI